MPARSYWFPANRIFAVEMLPVGIRLEPGSHLRLDIANSDFPAFDRNHNTGGQFWSESELRVARQTVFHDAARASRLILPAIRQA